MARRPAAPAVPATWDRVLAHRVTAHGLDTPPGAGTPPGSGPGDLVALVRRLCGVHAQLAASAEAALWLRGGIPAEAVRRALTGDRTLVKTWAVRGTLHLLPAADLGTWAAALGTRSFPRPPSWYLYHGVSADDMAAIEATVPEVLGAEPVTREDLAAAVAARTGRPGLAAALLSGWGAVLKPMAARGQLAFGPPDGRSVTFVAPRAWVGEWEAVDPATAVQDVLRAFLTAYGPADLDELARWSALDRPVLRAALAALAGELVELDVEGHRGWMTAAGAAAVAAAGPSRVVRLLPGFDPYVVGLLRGLEHLLPAGVPKSAVSRASGWVAPVLIDGGRVVATWSAETTAGRYAVEVTPLTALPAATRAAAEADATRWAAHAGAPLTLTWTT
jgi:hypothetical protein